MKILYHHRTASRDGQSTHLDEMIRALRANGHEVRECGPPMSQRHLAQGSVHDCLNYLLDLGYEGEFINRGRLRPIKEFDLAIHQSAVGDRFWTADAYCNNFVFHHRG